MPDLRALIPILTMLLLAHPVSARPPLAREQVAGDLAQVARQSDPRGLMQLLALLDHLDALTPEVALASLRELSQGRSLRAARAALELAALTGGSAPGGVITEGLAVPELAPDGDILSLHRHLVRRGAAALDAPFDDDDPDRRWSIVSAGPVGAIALDQLVPGPGRVVLQVALPITVTHATTGLLRLGASGDLAVSIAGAEARFLGVATALERAVPDQLEVPLALAPGRYVLLFTLRPNPAEPALLRVRFDPAERADGSTAGSAVATAEGESAGPVAWRAFEVAADPPVLAWNGDVRQLMGGSNPARRGAVQPPLDGLVLARLMGLPDLTPRRADVAWLSLEDRLATSPTTPHETLLALAAIRRPEDRASLLLARLAPQRRCPTCTRAPSLLLALAEHTAERGQLIQAGALVDEAALAPPGPESEVIAFMRARLARLAHTPEETLIAYGLAAPNLTPAEALRRLAAFPERARVEVAQAALDLGRADLALALVSQLAALYPGRLDLALTRIRAALAAGDSVLAATLAEALAARRPDRPTLALDAAAKLLAADRDGDRMRARALAGQALPRLSWKPDALVDAGRVLESLDDRPAALLAYARALEVSPAHEDARRCLERLQGAEPVPLTLDVDAVANAPVVDPDASFEVLGEEQFVKVRGDGSATRWNRRILRAQTVPEAREARTLNIRFDPTQESVRVLDATIRRAPLGGTSPISAKTPAEPVPERLLQSIAEDWYGLYYDLRQLAVPFDHLQRGDIIEVTWRIDPVGQLFPGVVDLFEVLLDRVPKHLHRITVETPPGIVLRTRLSHPEGTTFDAHEASATLPDGGTRHSVEVTGLPGLPLESLAPGTAEVSPVWQATTFTSWAEVATWYRRLVEPQKVLTPAMKAFVASARANKATPGEVLARLAEYVTREIRYVGLEFGIHGYKPYRSDHVWSRRFGDCKDKATLLSALMAEAGITGDVTLVRTRKQGRLAGALPSLSLFDHAVVYARGRDELIDPTATYYGLGELPKDDQGAQILILAAPPLASDVVLGMPARPVDLAISRIDPPSRNGISGTYSVTLAERGGAGIQGTVAFLGTQAPAYRALLLDPASQKLRLGELMNRRFPGLALRDFRISDPRDKTRPFELVFHAEVPRFGQLQSDADGTLYVTRPTGIDGHLERFASEERRRLPLVLGPPMRWDVTYRYILPSGHRARELPPGGEASGPYGSYRVSWLDEGAVVTVRAELTYAVDQVAVADYAGLRDFVRAFDAVVATPLVLARIPAAPRTGSVH